MDSNPSGAQGGSSNASGAAIADTTTDVAVLGLTVDYLVDPIGIDDRTPSLGWRLVSAEHSVRQSAYQVRAASSPQDLELDRPDLWDSGKTASAQQTDIVYAGRPPAAGEEVFWQVRVWTGDDRVSAWSPVARWEMGLLEPNDWTAQWISDSTPSASLPIFAHRFTVPTQGRIERARLYVSGLGLYEPRLNGRKVGADVLTPSVTDYRKRTLYRTYDVSEHLRAGNNVVGVMVGNGFFNVPEREGRYWESVTWKSGLGGSGETVRLSGEPKVIAQLEIRYADGTVQRVSSDASWRVDDGPIEFSGYYGGEDYDARRWQSNWDHPDGDHSHWRYAALASDTPAVLSAQFEPAVAEAQRLTAVELTEPEPGVYVFDFGTCFVGWPCIEVEGPAGTRVALVPGWYLDDGRVSQSGMVGWVPNVLVADHYTLSGDGVETWHPRFGYHGFRFLEVRGLPTAPSLSSVTGIVVRAATGATAEFECSAELLNTIYRIADRSLQSAMVSPTMPTDPNREKAGWQADRDVALSGVYRYDFAAYNQAMLREVFDAQRGDGDLQGIVPDPTGFWYIGDTNWTGAPIVQAYESYRRYGDAAPLRRHYPAMRQYFQLLRSREKDGIYPAGEFSEGYFGDWMYPGQHWQKPFDPDNAHFTAPETTVTWGSWRIAVAMAGIAQALDRTDDAHEFGRQAEEIAAAYHREFFDPATATYANGTQTATAIALDMGAPPRDLRDAVLAALVENIRESGNHLNAGMIGLLAIVRVLTDEGRHDVLYDVAVETSYPSYGYWLEHGATSLPESWEWTNREGVADLNILGGLTSWFTQGLAGIRQEPTAIAFDRVRIAPAIVGSLTSAAATIQTVRGEITSRWHRDGTAATVKVSIPANSTATIVVPLLRKDAELTASDDAQLIDRDERSATYRTGSGTWTFEQR
ncbi:alpha-L-rhamnosidase [Nocardia tenerifensis]|uniref:alpha-L-rhamnosidase n=1 Tax=Nocardia tenerifensis TaxID=228006 RepID=A0A318JZI4_9NOCA|nr:family 78 glycoside hydrolase catalytic domain [Nocardia tenerifensis]PXX59780.1 alpha-L-rhamnosidase [Nocardia tenerifensis]